jgi:AraC-like DNA-binding protein
MDRYGLAWIVKGHGVTHYDDVVIHTREGSVLMVRPGMTGRHDWGNVPCFQCFIVFGFDEVASPWPSPSKWPLVRQLAEDHFFFDVWKSLLRFDAQDERTLPLVVPTVELLVRIFVSGEMSAPLAGTLRLPETVERAVGIIRKHVDAEPAKALRLPELARKVHVTPQHLCRLFKESVGLGPIECAQALRLELASTLLERTELSLNMIAERFGFSSQFHFSRAFKHGYGMSPSHYRRAFRDGLVTRPPGLMFRNHPMRRYFYERAPGKIDDIATSDSTRT